jgi:hypothetical protein
MMRWLAVLLVSVGCLQSSEVERRQQGVQQIHQVFVNSAGGFSPAALTIDSGDRVDFILSDPSDAIIPATVTPGTCHIPKAIGAPDDFTGPRVFGPGGVWLRAPKDNGLSVSPYPSPSPSPCSDGSEPVATSPTAFVCETGARAEVLESSIADPAITGVLLTFYWADIQKAPINKGNPNDDSMFDWTMIDREVDKAVRHGKLYKLNVMAGKSGTPDWIFDSEHRSSPTAPIVMRANGGGVPRLYLRDAASNNNNDTHCGPYLDNCGSQMDLGSPTHPMFKVHYFAMLSRLARHLKQRADRYHALAFVQVSGANLFTGENRLPKRCIEGCEVCNTTAWAQAGYTDDGLYLFYEQQLDHIQTNFSDKMMSYALIQSGFPRVGSNGDHLFWDPVTASCLESGPDVPGGTEQTTEILDRSLISQGIYFGVQHNGLGPTGSLNQWVIDRGGPSTVTGYQMNNDDGVATPADVEAAFYNLQALDANASWVEIYEERLWDIQNNGGLPTTTLADWDDQLHDIREAKSLALGAGRPMLHQKVFFNFGGAPKQLFYINPSDECAATGRPFGKITVNP